MLTDGRITCFNSVSRPTRSRRLFTLRDSFFLMLEGTCCYTLSPNFDPQLGLYIFHRVLSDPEADILCSEEWQTKKLLANML